MRTCMSSELEKLDWQYSFDFSFYDCDTAQSKTGCLYAGASMLSPADQSQKIQCSYNIVGYINHNMSPWIIIPTTFPPTGWQLLDSWNNLIFTNNCPGPPGRLVDNISKFSLLQEAGWLGTTVYENSKRGPEKAYEDCLTACKAAEIALAQETWECDNVFDPDKPIQFTFVKPVVILRGPLFQLQIDSNKRCSLKKVDFAPLSISHHSDACKSGEYAIDIISLSVFNNYLGRSTWRLADIHTGISMLAHECRAAKE